MSPHYLSVSNGLEILALVGMAISVYQLIFNKYQTWTFVLQLLCYQSIYKTGIVFMNFQWDVLLLEMTWLAVLSTLLPSISFHLIRALGFRLMFQSGVSKLLSGCPTWWGLTALDHHFQTQCLPTPLAHFAHENIPAYFKKYMVAGVFYLQLVTSFFFYGPRYSRFLAGCLHVGMQISIILTGNYNFFNLLAIVLLVPCFTGPELFIWNLLKSKKFSKMVTNVVDILLLPILTLVCFNKYVGPDDKGEPSLILDMYDLLFHLDTWMFPLAILLLLLSVGLALRNLSKSQTKIIFTLTLCVSYFFALKSTRDLVDKSRPWSKNLGLITNASASKHDPRFWNARLLGIAKHYDFGSSYGLFARMTGVKNGRPELIVELSDDPNKVEYETLYFEYKPSAPYTTLPIVAPHQPRLDWQFWFAALQKKGSEVGWMWTFLYRLMEGSEDVWALLDHWNNNHFGPAHRPKRVRVRRHFYGFTDKNMSAKERDLKAIYSENDTWYQNHDYVQTNINWIKPFEQDTPWLQDHLKKLKIMGIVFLK